METKDIVKTRKNDYNHYRFCEALDINFFTEFKKFRSFNFIPVIYGGVNTSNALVTIKEEFDSGISIK